MSFCAYCHEPIPTGKRADAKFCSDRCRRAADSMKPAASCEDCGTVLTRNSVRHGAVRCRPCDMKHRRACRDARLDRIEAMYREGLPVLDIAEAVGRARRPGSIGPELDELRKLGRLPYRYSGYGEWVA